MGWAWCKEHYLVFSPHHLKGGVVRSNIKWFSAKAWLKNKQKDFVTAKEPQYNDKGKIEIDPFLCAGCAGCLDVVCPTDAFIVDDNYIKKIK